MARATRDPTLENPSNRLRLGKGEWHFTRIGDGLALGYRRPAKEKGAGVWFARLTINGKQSRIKIGEADDYQNATENPQVRTYKDAQEACRELMSEALLPAHKRLGPMTVEEAAKHYMRWYADHRKDTKGTQQRIDAFIIPALGNKNVGDLTAPEIRAWHESLAASPPRVRSKAGAGTKHPVDWSPTADQRRARRDSANRTLTILKAILNKAFTDGLVPDDVEWRRVKPFPKTTAPVVRFLNADECIRLINACLPDFRSLVRGALLTGTRYGELQRMTAADYVQDQRGIWVRETKSGHPRFVALNREGTALFDSLTAGKAGEEPIFMRADGKTWGKSHQDRPMRDACRLAKIDPPISFHELRHTYASSLIQNGVSLELIADLLGHADTRMTIQHYAHLADACRRKAVESLPDFGFVPDRKVAALRGGRRG